MQYVSFNLNASSPPITTGGLKACILLHKPPLSANPSSHVTSSLSVTLPLNLTVIAILSSASSFLYSTHVKLEANPGLVWTGWCCITKNMCQRPSSVCLPPAVFAGLQVGYQLLIPTWLQSAYLCCDPALYLLLLLCHGHWHNVFHQPIHQTTNRTCPLRSITSSIFPVHCRISNGISGTTFANCMLYPSLQFQPLSSYQVFFTSLIFASS